MLLAQLTDLHLRAEGQPCHRVSETNMLSERAFRAVARLRSRPDAIIVSGDISDTGQASSYAVMQAILHRHVRATPVYMIPGNHDDRAIMRAEMAGWPGMADPSGFVQYTVEHFPVRLVLLDTVVPGQAHGALCDARLDWLERTLSASPERPTIVVMHHPPFACGLGFMDTINLRTPERFVAIIARHRQVARILCGHHHRAVFAPVAHAIASIAPSVAHQLVLDLHGQGAPMLTMEPPAYQLHLFDAGAISTHTTFVEDFPGPYPFLAD